MGTRGAFYRRRGRRTWPGRLLISPATWEIERKSGGKFKSNPAHLWWCARAGEEGETGGDVGTGKAGGVGGAEKRGKRRRGRRFRRWLLPAGGERRGRQVGPTCR
uniref:Uncharacterized protein n=1 Tax=Oryza sativa subsp. japonica TaxID=39947 RepID=Q69PP3_ORYSJ|nr:hypothetical protein [Oryza sativa Japonica Group]